MKNIKNKGIVCIILAAFFFSLMTLFVRMSGDLPTYEKVLFRNLIAAIIAWILLFRHKERYVIPVEANAKEYFSVFPYIKKEALPDLILRSACGIAGMVCNFYAIDRLNIADANILNKLSPFFAILFSIFLLKEKVKKWEWGCVILAFAGAIFIIKPGFSMTLFPAIIGLLGGLGAGIAYTFVRRLGTHGVKGPIIVMFFSTFSTLVMLPFFIASYQPMTITQLLFLILAGCAAAGGQLSITAAYTFAPAKEISVFDYTQVIFATLWGFLFFAQIPDYLSFIGYGFIALAAIIRWKIKK